MRCANTAIFFDGQADARRNTPAARSEQAFEFGNGIGIHAQGMGVTRRRLKSGRAGFMIAQFQARNKMGES
jgi:hypothetical protein